MDTGNNITYRQKMTSTDLWRYTKAILFPLVIMLMAMVIIDSLAGFGSKLVAPMTGAMWAIGILTAILLPSQRRSMLREVHVVLAVYLAFLFGAKQVVVLLSGVSSEMLMAAFNTAMPITSGSAISGWVQTLMWITAVMTPVGYLGKQVKAIFTFRRKSSEKITVEELRNMRQNGNS